LCFIHLSAPHRCSLSVLPILYTSSRSHDDRSGDRGLTSFRRIRVGFCCYFASTLYSLDLRIDGSLDSLADECLFLVTFGPALSSSFLGVDELARFEDHHLKVTCGAPILDQLDTDVSREFSFENRLQSLGIRLIPSATAVLDGHVYLAHRST
jgi:hypothetical protein